jgi:mannose-6-phosphate isomerase-like protein (cupin superfamily)
MKSGKVWGEILDVCRRNGVQVNLIRVTPGYRCSRHSHRHKSNMFHVHTGTLVVKVEKAYGLTDKTRLTAGQSMTVAPGEVHWFENTGVEEVVALEVYWAELDENDIERANSGGRIGE